MPFVHGQILVGPVAGPHISWTSFDDKSNREDFTAKPVVGFHAGAGITFRVRERFFLNAALLYATKGKVIEGKRDLDLRNEVTYKSIDLPIVYTAEFKNRVGTNKVYKWFVGGGPNISYWLGGKGTLRSSYLSEEGIDELKYKIVFKKNFEDIQDNEMNVADPNRLQIGLNITTGIVFEPVGLQKIMFTVRYEIGHSFLGKTGNGVFPSVLDYADILRARNSGVRLSFAYFIDLKTDQRKKGKSTIDKRKL